MMSVPSGSASISQSALAPAASILFGVPFRRRQNTLSSQARVNTNHSPHSMIVRHDHDSRRPNHVEDGERIRVKDFLDFSTLRFAQSFEDCRWVGYGMG